MARARRKTLERRAQELGAILDWGECDLNVDAPRGKVWVSTRTSTLAIPFAQFDGSESWRPEAYGQALELMEDGVQDAPVGYEGWWGVKTENGVEAA